MMVFTIDGKIVDADRIVACVSALDGMEDPAQFVENMKEFIITTASDLGELNMNNFDYEEVDALNDSAIVVGKMADMLYDKHLKGGDNHE